MDIHAQTMQKKETRSANKRQTRAQKILQGVDLQALEAALKGESVVQSAHVLLVKNLPNTTVETDLRSLFTRHGTLDAFVMPPSKTMALVSFSESECAKHALRDLAYTRYKNMPLYLQWAPEKILRGKQPSSPGTASGPNASYSESALFEEDELRVAAHAGRVLFVKNLDFSITEQTLDKHIRSATGVRPDSVSIPRRKGKSGEDLSSGFGFVQFESEAVARKAAKSLDQSILDGRVLEVKMSERPAMGVPKPTSETSAKLIVRNLAFETTKREIKHLFAAFGLVKSVRLPKKFDGSLRGFAFVEFMSHAEAKAAFSGLSSTHLYGRHLVIEWARGTQDEDEEMDGE